MKKINNRGITLVALVITIIILLILASIATYSGLNVVKFSKLTTFTTEMKIMQTKVNEIYQKYKDGDSIEIDGTTYYGENKNGEESTILDIGQTLDSVNTQANKVFTESASGITDTSGYKYWDNELVKKLGIDGVDGDFFVNVEKRSIVSYDGFTYEGKDYYTLSQLPNNLYNVDYEDKNGEEDSPTFDVTSEEISDKEWKITVSNIQYNGYINKWYVKYKEKEQEIWQTTENMSFTVSESGTYVIKIENGNVSSEEKETVVVKKEKKTVNPGVVVNKTEKDNYEDLNGNMATIPEGFYADEIENSIPKGLVVHGPDESEFVWVPVPDINNMSQCSTAGGNCDLQLINGELKCVTHDNLEIVGKLYFSIDTIGSNTITDSADTTYSTESIREPAYLESSEYGDASSDNIIGLTFSAMQEDYKNMATSVAKYGGFYVGRYETSLSDATASAVGINGIVQSKQGVIPSSANDTGTYMWYGLYSKQNKKYVGTNNSVESSMIWGSQYDRIINWVKEGKSKLEKEKLTNTTLGNNSSQKIATTGNNSYSNDSINNIRDLGGNLYEWTQEAMITTYRTFRGGGYSSNDKTIQRRNATSPIAVETNLGSRMTLYIK